MEIEKCVSEDRIYVWESNRTANFTIDAAAFDMWAAAVWKVYHFLEKHSGIRNEFFTQRRFPKLATHNNWAEVSCIIKLSPREVASLIALIFSNAPRYTEHHPINGWNEHAKHISMSQQLQRMQLIPTIHIGTPNGVLERTNWRLVLFSHSQIDCDRSSCSAPWPCTVCVDSYQQACTVNNVFEWRNPCTGSDRVTPHSHRCERKLWGSVPQAGHSGISALLLLWLC